MIAASRLGTAAGRQSSLATAATLVLLIMAAYLPGLGGGFAFDDFPNIVYNDALHVTNLSLADWIAAAFSSSASALQRPLAMLSFAANHYFTGLAPGPMKLTNMVLHACNALLVLGVARRLLSDSVSMHARAAWSARFVATAWALQPINAVAVLLVVQRMEVLSHTFVFAGLWAYLVGRGNMLRERNGWPWIVLGIGLGTGLGVLAKESAVLLPLYAFLAEICVFRFSAARRRDTRILRALYIAGFVLTLAIAGRWLTSGIDLAVSYGNRGYSLAERVMTEARVLVDYLQWTFLPRLGALGLYHDDYAVSHGLLDPPATLLSVLALVALAVGALVVRRRRPLLALGILWFLSAHVLTATIIPLELVFEHRNYFASLGLCLALADLLLIAPSHGGTRRVATLLAVIAIAWYGATTWARAREWSNPYRFAATEAARHPGSPRATYGLGQTLVAMSGYRKDSPLLDPAERALERARSVPGAGILPAQGLILLAAMTDRPQDPDWWDEMQARLADRRIGAQDVGALETLTRCARDGRCAFPPGRMEAVYDAAMTTGQPDILTLKGDYLLNVRGDREQALALWRRAKLANPAEPQYRENLIKLLVAQGRDVEARREIRELRHLGRFGQTEAMAARLEQRLQARDPGD